MVGDWSLQGYLGSAASERALVMANYNVLEEAAALVDSHLELLQLLHEGKKLQIAERSRIACHGRSSRPSTPNGARRTTS